MGNKKNPSSPRFKGYCYNRSSSVFNSHSEAINIEFENPVDVDEARKILAEAPGVVVVDNPANNEYPLPFDAAGTRQRLCREE